MTGGDFRTMTFVSTPTCNPLLTFPLESAEDILRHEFFVRTFYRSLKLVKNPASLVVLYAYFKLLTGSGVPYKTFSTYLGKALETNFDSAMLSLNAMIEQGDNIEARMRGITAPTMVIVGEKDVIVKPDFERIKAAMPLHAEMIVFPKSTHFPNAEKLKEFNECLLAFLSRHDGINPFAVA
jgi:pimeloyl-ACP methyl ester carboxylesterase